MPKSQLTLECEKIFECAFRTAFATWFECKGQTLYPSVWKEQSVKYGKYIDFVVGYSSTEDHMYLCSQCGVELKTSEADFKSGCGQNFFSFRYNYLLVPEPIAWYAMRFLNKHEELSHVGLLVITNNCVIEYARAAKFYESEKLLNDGIKDVSVDDAIDCLTIFEPEVNENEEHDDG